MFATSANGKPIAGGTTCGQAHIEQGIPNQDRFGVNASAKNGFVAVCVCDGHGAAGAEAAELAAKTLMIEVELQVRSGVSGEDAVRCAMHAAEAELNHQHIPPGTGATATLALRVGQNLYVASVGDCEAVIVRQHHKRHEPYELIAPAHKTYVKEEKDRILSTGALIEAGAVVLRDQRAATRTVNITRALGDLDLRKHGIIAEPSVSSYAITKRDAMLIIGSDGLWGDSLGDGDVAPHEFFADSIRKLSKTPRKALQKLFEMLGRPSDDATVVVLRLN